MSRARHLVVVSILAIAVGLVGLGGYDGRARVAVAAHDHARSTVSDDEACLAAGVSAARAAVGLGALRIDPGLASFARAHADAMREAGTIFHSGGTPTDPEPGAGALRSALGAPYSTDRVVGENVGTYSLDDCGAMNNLYLHSPGHYANMVGASYLSMGVGVAFDAAGALYTSTEFASGSGASLPPAPKPAPSPVPVRRTPPPFVTTPPPKPSPIPSPRAPTTPAPIVSAALPLTDTASVSASAQSPPPGAVSATYRPAPVRRQYAFLVTALAAVGCVISGVLTYAVVAARKGGSH